MGLFLGMSNIILFKETRSIQVSQGCHEQNFSTINKIFTKLIYVCVYMSVKRFCAWGIIMKCFLVSCWIRRQEKVRRKIVFKKYICYFVIITYLSTEMQTSTKLDKYNPNVRKNIRNRQAISLAYHWTVKDQTISSGIRMNVTWRTKTIIRLRFNFLMACTWTRLLSWQMQIFPRFFNVIGKVFRLQD